MLIPHGFKPRNYQLPALRAMDSGFDRAFLLCHRRAGKDLLCWNLIIKKAFERVGVYYYLLPTYTQARKVIFDGITNEGRGFLDYIPEKLIESKDMQQLKIKLTNGSIIQLIGTDKYDSIRGTNPIGCVFSEYAFHNPLAWEVVRPILAANGGWAVFNTTPNGKNHAYKLWQMAEENEKWFTQKLTVADTSVVSSEVLEDERKEMSREMFQQEYHVSFDVGMIGSVYGEAMETANIGNVPIHQRSTDIYFDLGASDSTAIWFKQDDDGFFNMVNYYENSQKKLEHYFEVVDDFLEANRASLGFIWLPHDSSHKHLGQDQSVIEQFRERYGEHKVKYIPALSISGRIDKARRIIPRVRFHKDNCKQGVACLENYHYKYDEKNKVYSQKPNHDWASHGADSFGYFAESIEIEKPQEKEESVSYDYIQVNPWGL